MEKMTPDVIALTRSKGGVSTTAPAIQPTTQPAIQPVARLTAAQSRRVVLARTVQLQVIPQLLRRSGQRGAGSINAHIERLAGLSLQASGNEVVDFVTGLRDNGFDEETIYLELLAPTAQLLGQYWADDFCTFADVTIGVGHLHTAMRALRSAFFQGGRLVEPGAPRTLLLPLPGEQHNFGASMLSAFFVRAGWDVWSGMVSNGAELAEMVRRDWIDLVGFSVSHDALIEATKREVAAVRAASRNAALVVMVGGLPFAQNPSLADVVGADGTAMDGAQAVEIATALLPISPAIR